MQVNLTKGVITVGSWTLLSRVLGMVREILLSTFIGAGPLLDAFVAAFRLPNIFRRFFAEGAFNAAFVPLFAKRYESKMEPLSQSHLQLQINTLSRMVYQLVPKQLLKF